TFYDANAGVYRYGAGDTRVGLRYTMSEVESQFKWSGEAFLTLPTSVDEGDRLVRAFVSKKTGWGAAGYIDFLMGKYSVRINSSYYNGNGIIKQIDFPLNTFWYNGTAGLTGITPNGNVINSSQANVGFGISRNFIFNSNIFAEYFSHNIFAENGKGKSIGNFAAGATVYQRQNLDLKLGVDMPLGEIRPNMGFFFDLRMNGVIGGRRVVVETRPILSEEEPALAPGRKPFFRKEGVVYSRIREPIRDTVIIIDGSPSMLGRGLVAGQEGEEVLSGINEFVTMLIDSLKNNSNISLITFADDVTSLSWRSINESKKEDILNSFRDVPDLMNIKTDELEADQQRPWKEMLEEAIDKAYQELKSFERSDYNKIHLQRIIVFSDGLDDSVQPHNITDALNMLNRRYQLDRDDKRYFYYMHTNPSGEGTTLDENIIRFVEKENGKVFRSLDIGNADQQTLSELKYNGIERRPALAYESQLTRLAILDVNTKGRGVLRTPMINAFNSVFDHNEFFLIKPQTEVQGIMINEGLIGDQDPEDSDLVRVGRRLGVDYVVYGEIIRYDIDRAKGLYLPYIFGLPKTDMRVEVAIRLIDVAEGTLEYVKIISATASRGDGIVFFPGEKENKMKQLSGIDLAELQANLMEKWAVELRDSMFEDRSVIITQ
ncbi:VWA domain-containing protein, partial [candidate division KSB1 bacterium]